MRVMIKDIDGVVRVAELEDVFYGKVNYDNESAGKYHYGLLMNYTTESNSTYFIELDKDIAFDIMVQILHTGFFDFTHLGVTAVLDFEDMTDEDEDDIDTD